MKKKDIIDAINDIEDEYIVEAAPHNTAEQASTHTHAFFKHRRPLIFAAAAACAAIVVGVLALTGVLSRSGKPSDSEAQHSLYRPFCLAEAVYPETVPYADWDSYYNENIFDSQGYDAAYTAWREVNNERQNQPEGYRENMTDFYEATMRELLSSTQENLVYSPLNLYIALGMLAETTDGNSRAQILRLLGVNDITSLRAKTKALWRANYQDDGRTTSVLANSLWLSSDISYNKATLEHLAEDYLASTFYGQMGSADYNHALQAWVNTQTGGLLEKEASALEMDSDTVAALVSTIYFQAAWQSKFYRTERGTFHGVTSDAECDFMKQKDIGAIYTGSNFSATAHFLNGSGAMWFILPDAGCTPAELLSGSELAAFLSAPSEWEDYTCAEINLSVPKFDVTSDIDLIEKLRALGITDVLDSSVSNFTPLTTDFDYLFLSSAQHAARVTIDEEGCTAAAYTFLEMKDESAPIIDISRDFIVDRPFLFAITSDDGSLLFVGVVNQL